MQRRAMRALGACGGSGAVTRGETTVSALMNFAAMLPLWLLLALILGLALGVAGVLVMLVRRTWPHPALKENNELVGFTYAVYGLIYGVILAFTIVTVWQQFEMAETTVLHESATLSELWRDANGLPAAVRAEIHRDIVAYVDAVIEREWHSMSHDGQADGATKAIYEDLWANSYGIEPSTKSEEAFLAEYLNRLNALSLHRRMRLMHCRSELHAILWLVLLFGAIPTVAYPLLFAARHAFVHLGLTTCIMALVLLCLLVTFSLQFPFTGNVSIKPDAFMALRTSLQERMAAGPRP